MDWYLTWRQMKELDRDGFEIGNHTVGHAGGLSNFMAMEDELYANGGPRMTTVCWPLYGVAWNICPDLAKSGYTFGRGGHERPYRPTVDNPFDVPSFTIRDGVTMERFIEQAQQACQGRVVVFTFHGVPDMEHTGVSLEPATFKLMMRYLKDNNYQCIAMRDLAKYIDPAKAAKLPPTAGDVEMAKVSIKDDKPYVAAVGNDIQEFSFAGLPSANIAKTNVSVTVPYGTEVTALAPNIKVSPDATVAPASGTSRDFTQPQTYTVTGRDGSTKGYVVTVKKIAISAAKDMLTFVLPGAFSNTAAGNLIGVAVPETTDVRALAPTFTLSPFAMADPASGTALDFTKPQTYTITAQDGSSQTVTVTAVKTSKANAFTWNKAESGNWSDGSRWSDNFSKGSAPLAAGRPDYVLNFNEAGKYDVTNDLDEGFQLNQLDLGVGQGNTLTLAGKGIRFAGTNPGINQSSGFTSDKISTPIELAADLAVNLIAGGGRVALDGPISGSGCLICNGGNGNESRDLNGGPNQHYSTLSLNCQSNTYGGGTIINGGTLRLAANTSLGTGPVTLNDGAGLAPGQGNATNDLILNGGTIDAGGIDWNAPITLNGNTRIAGRNVNFNNTSGEMSGPGGFTVIGTWMAFGRGNDSELNLWGANTYTGQTIIHQGALFVRKAVALYHADPAQWTPERISVHPAATLVISAGGPGELSGGQVGTLLKNLTAAVNDNGLMARSTICLDTSNAKESITVSADIMDSKGPGGGAFLIKKVGAGALRLSGNSTHTGQTILEGGTLIVSSLNSFTEGSRKASSSLGAPMDIEVGEIVIGEEGKDGDCALVYTGAGETTDRVMNLAGKKSSFTLDQSGRGLLKLTSDFVISGYGHDKTVALTGSTAGSGEIAGEIANPYDRAGKAVTTLTKSGTGTWTLSGTSTFTGPTTVNGGTLSLANAGSLGEGTEVTIASGATLELKFNGSMTVRELALDGQLQLPGMYAAKDAPGFIKGTGVLSVLP